MSYSNQLDGDVRAAQPIQSQHAISSTDPPVSMQSGTDQTGKVSSSRQQSSSSSSRRSPTSLEHDEGGSQDKLSNHSFQNGSSGSRPAQSNHHDASRRQSHRNSGGFLLNPLSSSSQRLLNSIRPRTSIDTKGKRRSDADELHVAKRRSRDFRNTPSSSLRSSLQAPPSGSDALEVLRDGEIAAADVFGTRALNTEDRSDRKMDFAGANGSADPQAHPGGYDTDPLQIVNMALSLSQARRRQASLRYVSGGSTRQRGVSGSSVRKSPPQNKSPGISRYMASTPEIKGSTNSSPIKLPNSPPSKLTQTVTPPPEGDLLVDGVGDETTWSAATTARVQKAKNFFELAYEHRRLLSHLPPLRDPRRHVDETDPDNFSRDYNPLQFVRDRKFRIWEEQSMNAEEEGWHDIDKVRAWVDTVVASAGVPKHAPDEAIRLPPLNLNDYEEDGPDEELSPNQSTQMLQNLKAGRGLDANQNLIRRPRLDWQTHPGDMIANAVWLEQGQNKLKVLDRDDRQIYPAHTRLKRLGWRNRTPLHDPEEFIKSAELAAARAAAQSSSPPPPEEREPPPHHGHKSPPTLIPDLPTFKSARHKLHDKRLARKLQKRDKSSSTGRRSGSRRRGLGIFSGSDSESTASDHSASEDEVAQRGRKRTSRKRQKFDIGNEDGIQPNHASAAVDGREAKRLQKRLTGKNSLHKSASHSKLGALGRKGLSRLMKVESNKSTENRTGSPIGRNQPRADSAGPTMSRRETQRTPRRSIDQGSSKQAYSAPIEWPSIAINLSPPGSRSPSPTKRARPSILHTIKSRSKPLNRITTADFADDVPVRPHRNLGAGSDNERYASSSGSRSRGASPRARGVSPFSRQQSIHDGPTAQNIETYASPDHRASIASKHSIKPGGRPSAEHNRIRGIFKGGRIAEIVGTEVSRVGDFILKRDPPPELRHHGSTSSISLHGSEDEHETQINGHIHKTPPQRNRPSRASTASSISHSSPDWSRLSVNSPPGQNRYHNVNLPNFTSPFQKDRDDQEKKQGLLSPTGGSPMNEEEDHIANYAAEHRKTSRSPRLERLAPPRLDTSRSPSRNRAAVDAGYGFGGPIDVHASQDAASKLNGALQGSLIGNRRFSRPGVDQGHYRSSTNLEITNEADENNVTRRDISRAEALLFSSVVKAREIGRRANRPQSTLPRFLLDSLTPENQAKHTANPLQIRPRDQYFVAAQNIVTTLTIHASSLQDKLDNFSSKTTSDLHQRLQKLEDRIENELAPRVRSTGDQAGELSVRLNSTSTRAVKELNDTIEGAFSLRTRGPLKFIRNSWFSMVEWGVVGLLWGIWAIVIFIKIFLGVFKGGIKMVRWLLWID